MMKQHNYTKRKPKIALWLCLALAAVLLLCCGIYLGSGYSATPDALSLARAEAQELQLGGTKVLLFEPEDAAGCPALIFYPGGKVQTEAYAPLCSALADRGILCALVEMPFQLSVFRPNAAAGVLEYLEENVDCGSYSIGGHSLGGVMAASFAAENASRLDGILFLASYSTKDLSDTGLRALSLYGSEDQVLNMKNYRSSQENVPADFIETVISGGCHAYFGSYGPQKGDGIPTLRPEEQQTFTADAIARWIFGE